MIKTNIKILILGIFLNGCRVLGEVEIKDYIKIQEDKYLVSYYYQILKVRSHYNFAFVSFSDKDIFYKSHDQNSILFEIRGYKEIEVTPDSVLIYTKYDPNLFIRDHRTANFSFKNPK